MYCAQVFKSQMGFRCICLRIEMMIWQGLTKLRFIELKSMGRFLSTVWAMKTRSGGDLRYALALIRTGSKSGALDS
jgi:hypothetical protein